MALPSVRLCTCSKIALTDGFGPNLHLKGLERVGVGSGVCHRTGDVARDRPQELGCRVSPQIWDFSFKKEDTPQDEMRRRRFVCSAGKLRSRVLVPFFLSFTVGEAARSRTIFKSYSACPPSALTHSSNLS